MSVSCTCFDYDASAKIGSLKSQTFEEIYAGEIAARFRRELAARRYPTNLCHKCYGLRWVPQKKAHLYQERCSPPSNMIGFENNVTCNLRCCNWRDVAQTRSQVRITLDDARKVAEIIKKYEIKKVMLYNWGEPFLSPAVHEEFRILRSENPAVHLEVSTNGLLLSSDDKRDAALLLDHVLFSIHGSSQETVAPYMQGGDFERAYANMVDLVRYRNYRERTRPIIEWKYIVFNWNDSEEEIHRAVDLARAGGVDYLSFWSTPFPPHGVSWRYFLKRYFRKVGDYIPGNPGSGERIVVDCRPKSTYSTCRK